MALPSDLDLLDVFHFASSREEVLVGLLQRVTICKAPTDGILAEGNLAGAQPP